MEMTDIAPLPLLCQCGAGSGLGTSSILVGTVLAAVARASGKVFDEESLNHAVLELEQMMSTGGGWQDQVWTCVTRPPPTRLRARL